VGASGGGSVGEEGIEAGEGARLGGGGEGPVQWGRQGAYGVTGADFQG